MPVTVEQLVTPTTQAQAREQIIQELESLGIPATSWQAGSIPRTVVEVAAKLWSDFTGASDTITGTVAEVAKAGFNRTASGGWLDLLSSSHYDNTRNDGQRTRGACLLSDGASGPHTIAVGQLVAKDNANGFTYRNVTGGTLGAGGTLTLDFEAEEIGADRNVANGTIDALVTVLGDVTISNPAIAGGAWYSGSTGVSGADDESDEQLQDRNEDKWATISATPTEGAYSFWAREASAAITRVQVDARNPRGPGTIDVYLAGANGPVTLADEILAYEHLEGYDGVGRRSITDNLGSYPATPLLATQGVKSATALSVPVQGKAYVLSTYKASVDLTALENAITEYFKTIPVGGTKTDPLVATGKVVLSKLHTYVLTSLPGLVSLELTTPLADTVVAIGEVAVPDLATIPITVVYI